MGPDPLDESVLKELGLEKTTNSFVQKIQGISENLRRRYQIESRSIVPVPEDQRTSKGYLTLFTLWFSANCNILSFSTGTLASTYGLDMKSAMLVILFINLICCIPPAYMSTFGPRLGLRQMVQARYSFGYFGVDVPMILGLCTMIGYCILNAIVGGQTLAAVGNNVSVSVGIVIITVIALLVSFMGQKFIHFYGQYAFIPVLIVFIILTGLGGKDLAVVPPPEPITPGAVLQFCAVIGGYVLTWSSMASDFTLYMRPTCNPYVIFVCVYFGFFLSCGLFQMLGAAFAISAAGVPGWETAVEDNVGKFLEVILSRAGGFGKFCTVLLAISVTANVTPTVYSWGIDLQILLPFLSSVPRFFFSVVAIAITIPLAIVGADHFEDTLSNFASLISYWSSMYVALIIMEHWIFRRWDCKNYDLEVYDRWRKLPLGAAALGACILSLGLVIPFIVQIWFTGPLAKMIPGSGELGFEIAFFLTSLFYIPLRLFEKKLWGA